MKPTLLVLAAGIGSRYGGLKQVDGLGPGGHAILEYSVYDAIRAGFGKVVFVIRKDIEDVFKEKIGNKVAGHIRVEYAFQELTTGLEFLEGNLPDRKKPWGTAHAVLAAKHLLDGPFAVINADDFYGHEAYETIGRFLEDECRLDLYAMVSYHLKNTLSENGSVSRGVCSVGDDQSLLTVIERTKIYKKDDGIVYADETGEHELSGKTLVSMNFWGFHQGILAESEEMFRTFVLENMENPKAEFFIPLVVNALIQSNQIKLKVFDTSSAWFGVTYTEDKETVQDALSSLVEQGVYPEQLWA